jgi:hypothetical protein
MARSNTRLTLLEQRLLIRRVRKRAWTTGGKAEATAQADR